MARRESFGDVRDLFRIRDDSLALLDLSIRHGDVEMAMNLAPKLAQMMVSMAKGVAEGRLHSPIVSGLEGERMGDAMPAPQADHE